uniref:Uncharacterized protein n=1 Tax=Solanum tuberosum TaxID=4113 RepID=M1CJA0_SOLTU
MQTKFPTSVLTDTKESNSVEEKKSLDNAALFDKSPQRDASVDLCVWDPGIDFGFMALTGYIKRTWRNYYCWNKCVVARQVVTELNLIMRKSFIVNQKDHGCNLVLSVLVERFGGRRALTTIAQYFEVNNYSIDKSMVRSTIFMMFRVLLDLLTLSVALVKFSASHYLAVLPTFWSIMEIFHLIKKRLMMRKNGMRSRTLQLLFGICATKYDKVPLCSCQ